MTTTHADLEQHLTHDTDHSPSPEQRTTVYILLTVCYLLISFTLYILWLKVNAG